MEREQKIVEMVRMNPNMVAKIIAHSNVDDVTIQSLIQKVRWSFPSYDESLKCFNDELVRQGWRG